MPSQCVLRYLERGFSMLSPSTPGLPNANPALLNGSTSTVQGRPRFKTRLLAPGMAQNGTRHRCEDQKALEQIKREPAELTRRTHRQRRQITISLRCRRGHERVRTYVQGVWGHRTNRLNARSNLTRRFSHNRVHLKRDSGRTYVY